MNTVDRLIVRLDEAVNSDCGDYDCPGHPSTCCVERCRVEEHIARLLDEAATIPKPHPVELRRLCKQANQILGTQPADKEATTLLITLFGEDKVG